MGRRLMITLLGMALAVAAAVPAHANSDMTAPTLDQVMPADGATVYTQQGDSFMWVVDAFDESALFELEVDNSLEPWVPQFTVYASEKNPYGDAKAAWDAVGATARYDKHDQKWVISFGTAFTDFLRSVGGITLYIEVVDEFDNQFGDMFNVTPEMTFTYVFATGTYEPYDKDSCKHGGWENFAGSFGFKNQGQCVKYVTLRDK